MGETIELERVVLEKETVVDGAELDEPPSLKLRRPGPEEPIFSIIYRNIFLAGAFTVPNFARPLGGSVLWTAVDSSIDSLGRDVIIKALWQPPSISESKYSNAYGLLAQGAFVFKYCSNLRLSSVLPAAIAVLSSVLIVSTRPSSSPSVSNCPYQ